MIRVGQLCDVSIGAADDGADERPTGRCVVVSVGQWMIEFENLDMPEHPVVDAMVQLRVDRTWYRTTVQRSDRRRFVVLRPATLVALPVVSDGPSSAVDRRLIRDA